MRSTLSLVTAFGFSAVVAAAACGSSNTGTGNTGTGNHGTTTGTGTGGTGGSTGSTTHTGTNSGSTSSTGTGTGSSGGPCYAGTTGYTALTASPTPAVHANACSATDISGFISACITGSSGCNAWFQANVAGEGADGGGAGTACGNCIIPLDASSGAPQNTGATFSVIVGTGSNQTLLFGPNYGGCIQLKDTTHGAACALAMDNLNDCENVACAFDGTSQCSQTDFDTCVTYATGTGQGCASAASAISACATDDADGGAAQICSPSGGSNQGTDMTYIINLICGSG